ncbi:protein of unknown function DUF86 [Desulfurispirillum indicum S5]|uniref:DUF86 domain-containing protein n=1 Tax=Desulfurispirillum indicum (strain ATCC BAA-1389 / DSM 22839 / S5) TaxID=653733 RepID=E6W034_DESIS|nr:DUF86 domain-containing protein [Desulfurispirillum indicum]ADU65160.1 protein of unknown function DUF86 [Desulfurispirillum indicum S5]
MVNDIVLNKAESIERCIRKVEEYSSRETGLHFEADHLKQDAIAFNLVRAAEQCIDLANHVVRRRKLGIPKESRDAFRLLASGGIIPAESADKLVKMVGFRNVLVHEYQQVPGARY